MNLDELIKTEQWSVPTIYEKHGISHGRSHTGALDNQIALDIGIEGPIHRCFLASIRPQGFIVPHIDQGPYKERWHVPIRAAGHYWEEGFPHPIEPQFGIPFLVRHYRPHAVFNLTDDERIHLIVDRDVPPEGDPPFAKLQLTDMIHEIGLLLPIPF